MKGERLTPARQLLVKRTTGLVDGLAAKVLRDWPDLHHADLIAVGNLALTEAATRYDAEVGTEFATFAWCHVRGAMIEHAKKEHFRFDARARAVVAALAEGELPDDDASLETIFGESAEQSCERTVGWTQRIAVALFVAAVRATAAPTPEEELSDAERTARGKRDLETALDRLQPADRGVVAWYFEERRPVDWIAGQLGVSSKTVRRKLDRIKRQLADSLRALED